MSQDNPGTFNMLEEFIAYTLDLPPKSFTKNRITAITSKA
jgi:hypothetical protein